MRRLFMATAISFLWIAIFFFALFAQEEIPVWVDAPNFAIPPFEPPIGAVITVTIDQDNLTDNGDCTLREAIHAANTDAAVDACPAGNGADLILLTPGRYGLSLEGRSEDTNATGDLDIRSSLVISGAGSEATVIDANAVDRVLHILTGTVEIRGITIQNGRAANGADSGCGTNSDEGCPGESGGGIFNHGTATLIDVVVQDNHSGDGGGDGADFEITNGGDGGEGGGLVNLGNMALYAVSVLRNGSGDGGWWFSRGGDGGGVLNAGIMIAHDLLVGNNRTGDSGVVPRGPGASGSGGGVANRGTITITNGQIFSNSTNDVSYSNGGGLYNSADAWLSESDIRENSAGLSGGGGIFNQSNLVLQRSTVRGNLVGAGASGGGLYNTADAFIVNSTITGNKSGEGHLDFSVGLFSMPGGDGAAILNTGTLDVENSTIVFNQAGKGLCAEGECSAAGGSGGGFFNRNGTATIFNSLVAGNTVVDGGTSPDCAGTVTSQGPNFIGDPTGCTLSGAGDDILNQHAFLGPLLDNGGPTLTHALLPYSYALNAGSCTDIGGAPITTDQRGEPRPQGAGCDLGAFESELSTIPLPETLYLPVIRQQPN